LPNVQSEQYEQFQIVLQVNEYHWKIWTWKSLLKFWAALNATSPYSSKTNPQFTTGSHLRKYLTFSAVEKLKLLLTLGLAEINYTDKIGKISLPRQYNPQPLNSC